MSLRKLMESEFCRLSAFQSVASAARLMSVHNVSCVLVFGEDGQLCGLVSPRYLLLQHPNRVVIDAMPEEVPSIGVGSSLDEALSLMAEQDVETLPVLDKRGDVVGIVSKQAIEAQRLAAALEKARREAELVHSALESAITMDRSGRILSCNPGAERLYGYSKEEIIGQNFALLVPADLWDQVREQVADTCQKGQRTKEVETVRVRKDRTRIDIRSVFSPTRDKQGEIDGLVDFSWDITEQKVLQQQVIQEARLAGLEQLAAGIGHEINNPLAVVIGYADLFLSQADLDDQLTSGLKRILEAGNRVKNIVANLQTFAVRQRQEAEYFDVNEMITKALDLVRQQSQAAGLEIIEDLDEAVSKYYGNAGQLQQVILNLIQNAQDAITASHTGSQVRVSTKREPEKLVIAIEDNGPGIPKAIRDRIFDPFFTTKAVGQGPGLGLSLCHGIIQSHRGKIWVQSEQGQGTRFVIELPSRGSNLKPFHNPNPSNPGPSGAEKSRGTILVVDDEESILELIRATLEWKGYTVDLAQDGMTMLEKIEASKFDLILLDLMLPDMRGEELYEGLRKRQPEIAEKVVFITGAGSSLNVMKFLKDSGRAYIPKPFTIGEVLNVVEKALAESSVKGM